MIYPSRVPKTNQKSARMKLSRFAVLVSLCVVVVVQLFASEADAHAVAAEPVDEFDERQWEDDDLDDEVSCK